MFRNTCMNYTEAFQLLEIDYDKASPYVFENIDEGFLKKRYQRILQSIFGIIIAGDNI